MKLLIFIPLLLASTTQAQIKHHSTILHVFENLWLNYELDKVNQEDLFVTKVWGRPAVIPLDDCKVAVFDENKVALAFDIYLEDTPGDYKNKQLEGIHFGTDINENSKYRGGGERLIQVLFYDMAKDKFIGKPQGFPIAGLPWIHEEITIPVEMNEIESLKTIENFESTVLLTIAEFSGMFPVKRYVLLKLYKDKILTSGEFRACIEEITEKNNSIVAKVIENCPDVEIAGMEEKIGEMILIRW